MQRPRPPAPPPPAQFFIYDGAGVNVRMSTAGYDKELTKYFAVGAAPDKLPPQSNPAVIELEKARRRWAGCGEDGGTRVLSVFAGHTVYQTLDVGWRVRPRRPNTPH